MRPARIEVFDGLRIATEHVDHLQDSLQSSIEDLREAAGLGKVIRGFDVQRDGDAAIVVGPGLAFDARKRRLALDEPQRVEASVPAGTDAQYVCIEHQVVEQGEVEGHPTLIWDGVSISLRDAPPGPDEDPVAVAKLARPPDPATAPFDVMAVDAPPPEPVPPVPAPPPTAPARVQQGVARLPTLGVPPVDAVAALNAAVDEQRAGGDVAEAAVVVALGATEIAPEMAVAAVTCAIQLGATVSRPDGTVGRLEAVGRGEATLDVEGVSRFGLSTIRRTQDSGAWTATDFAEDGVASLPLASAMLDAAAADLLPGLRLVVDVRAAAPAGVGLSCALAYSGPLDEKRATAIRDGLVGLDWTAAVGWKALAT
jgi:hypothetical protein